jgi:outer membrane protein assembly factor BamB
MRATMVRTGFPLRELPPAVPWVAGLLAAALLAAWWLAPVRAPIALRVPGTDRPAGAAGVPGGEAPADVFAAGLLIAGPGKPAEVPGAWPRFRGPNLDGRSQEAVPLARSWTGGRPRELWAIEVGEGYAGPAIDRGRVYLMDYDREKGRDALRCLSLADGREIWRFSYPVSVKRNHGLTRTVPSVAGRFVVAMGPKCHVVCAEAEAGKFQWGIDLVKDHGTTIPAWYTGQCPLVDGDAVILAPGGPEALLLAVDLATGKIRWKTPNPNDWKMTHSSITPLELGGRKYYLYCGSGGVAAVSATDGAVAWETAKWKINIATVPTPVILDDGRVFFTGGYNAGSMLVRFTPDGPSGKLAGTEVFRVKAPVFGATQHSPVWFEGHLYGIRADGRLVCLAPDGKVVWASGPETNFGLGPLMIADRLILAMDDAGKLTLAEAVPTGFKPLAEGPALTGEVHEAWAPFALAGGRLLARDMTRMVCLQVGQ